jgi:hypothetical protein
MKRNEEILFSDNALVISFSFIFAADYTSEYYEYHEDWEQSLF